MGQSMDWFIGKSVGRLFSQLFSWSVGRWGGQTDRELVFFPLIAYIRTNMVGICFLVAAE